MLSIRRLLFILYCLRVSHEFSRARILFIRTCDVHSLARSLAHSRLFIRVVCLYARSLYVVCVCVCWYHNQAMWWFWSVDNIFAKTLYIFSFLAIIIYKHTNIHNSICKYDLCVYISTRCVLLNKWFVVVVRVCLTTRELSTIKPRKSFTAHWHQTNEQSELYNYFDKYIQTFFNDEHLFISSICSYFCSSSKIVYIPNIRY